MKVYTPASELFMEVPGMPSLAELDPEKFSPARIWAAISPDVRLQAARAVYASEDPQHRTEADLAIAMNLKFRPVAVRKLPVEKRAGYIARAFPPGESLASTLLLCLHSRDRVGLMAAFLDSLGIPHNDGMIDEDHDLQPPEAEPLTAAVNEILEKFDREEVELYLATLLAMDPGTWGGLKEPFRKLR